MNESTVARHQTVVSGADRRGDRTPGQIDRAIVGQHPARIAARRLRIDIGGMDGPSGTNTQRAVDAGDIAAIQRHACAVVSRRTKASKIGYQNGHVASGDG